MALPPVPRAAWWARRHGRRCRVCGCTDLEGCPGGCFWVDDDLCSACLPDEEWDQ